MELIFAKSNWEVPELTLKDFLIRAKQSGYSATEIYLPARAESALDMQCMHSDSGLRLIAQISTAGSSLSDHKQSLKERFVNACAASPLFVNCHTGRDVFSFDDSLELLNFGAALARDQGVELLHETHRGRIFYTAHLTANLLQTRPEIRLTADFSHWFCVHESDLRDQAANVSLAIEASDHIHARIGFDQGPQVAEPRAEINATWLTLHLEHWRAILRGRAARGRTFTTITPEFGPAPYMPLPTVLRSNDAPSLTGAASTYIWDTNLWMKELLEQTLVEA